MPLSAYVKVDFLIHGCPVNPDEVVRILEELLAGRKPEKRGYSVCFECKLAGNECRLINKKPCLGPITQGGCGAVCVSGGSACYGCFGFQEEPSIKGLLNVLSKFSSPKEIDRLFTMFLRQSKEYKEIVEPKIKNDQLNQ